MSVFLDGKARLIFENCPISVIVSPMSGVVLVKARPQELRAVETYLKATQLMVERQVMLEAKIVEVSLNDSFQTGINWAKFGGNNQRFTAGILAPGTTLSGGTAPITGTAATSGTAGSGVAVTPGTAGAIAATALGQGFFGLAFQSKDFAALVSFLETQGDHMVRDSGCVARLTDGRICGRPAPSDQWASILHDVTLCPHHAQRALVSLRARYDTELDRLDRIINQKEAAAMSIEAEINRTEIAAPATYGRPVAKWRWPYAHMISAAYRYDDGTVAVEWTCGGGAHGGTQFLDILPDEFAVCPRCITADEVNAARNRELSNPMWRNDPDADRMHSARAETA
jgi:hypothetical protein